MRFKTTVELAGKTATGFEVPAEVVESLGSGKKPAVTLTIRDFSYRSTVASMGGRFMIPLSAENRNGAGVATGDEIEVDIELDAEPRELAVPDDLLAALEAEAAAKTYFNHLSYSNKRRIVLNIEGAKTAETRQRRVEKAIASLKEDRMP